MTKQRFIEEVCEEEHVHKTVWLVAQQHLARKGGLLDDLVAMVFVSHALEGYANFLLERVAPDLWKEERDKFRKSGLAGKLAALHEKCGLKTLEKGRRPHSTIQELKLLRDSIAHPKPRRTKSNTEYAEGEEAPSPFPKSYLEQFVSREQAKRAMQDVKEVADRLHAAAVARFHDKGLGPAAFDNILATRSATARLKQ